MVVILLKKTVEIWNDFNEDFLLEVLEKYFTKQGYQVENLHKSDRSHESGIDLICKNDLEELNIQAKIKPNKTDIEQFDLLTKNSKNNKAIYIHIKDPTVSFKNHVKSSESNVEFWDPSVLHNKLIISGEPEYICLYFSNHPLITTLVDVHMLISENRRVRYNTHNFSSEELATLWSAKDNSVKARIAMYFIFQKWNKILMSKTTINTEEFEEILKEIVNDLDMAYEICGSRLVSSFEDLSTRYPNIIGLYWELASHRTNWSTFTTRIERVKKKEDIELFSHYSWICPVINGYCLFSTSMNGFYSTLNYFLENLYEITTNLEDGLDWVFSEMNRK